MTLTHLSALILFVVFAIDKGNAFYCPRASLYQGEGLRVSFSPYPNHDPVPIGGGAFAVCQNPQDEFHGDQLSVCSSRGWTPWTLGYCKPKWSSATTTPFKTGDIEKGSILVIGGDPAPSPMEWYNPFNSRQNGLLNMPSSQLRITPVSAVLKDRRVLIAGGRNANASDLMYSSSVFLLNPMNETWEWAKSMHQRREWAAAAVINGVVYICGGWNGSQYVSSCERFLSDVWEPIAPMNKGRGGFAMVAIDGTLYAMGGLDTMSTMESYNIKTDTWTLKKSMPRPLYDFGAAVFGQSIVVCGRTSPSCDKYDVEQDTWSSFPPMKQGRTAFSMVSVEGGLVALGGRSLVDFGYLDTVEMFNPKANQWTLLPRKLLKGRCWHSAVVF